MFFDTKTGTFLKKYLDYLVQKFENDNKAIPVRSGDLILGSPFNSAQTHTAASRIGGGITLRSLNW